MKVLTMYGVYVEQETEPRAMFQWKDDAQEWADQTFFTVQTSVRVVAVRAGLEWVTSVKRPDCSECNGEGLVGGDPEHAAVCPVCEGTGRR